MNGENTESAENSEVPTKRCDINQTPLRGDVRNSEMRPSLKYSQMQRNARVS